MLSNELSYKYCLITIAVLAFVLGLLLRKPIESVEVVKHVTDTITVVKTDTITVTKVIEKTNERKVVDTVYIYVNDTIQVPVPISQYHFFEKDKYDIFANGYNVSIESVSIYPKTIYQTITNDIETVRTVDYWAFYAGGGLWWHENKCIPHLSVAAKTPKKWIISADIGYYNKSVIVGGKALYNITAK